MRPPLSRLPRRRFALAGFAIVWLLGAATAGADPAPPLPLERIEDVRDLPAETAATALPVHIRGVVTWRSDDNQLVIQAGATGVWLHLSEARAAGLWKTDDRVLRAVRVGDLLEIDGFTHPGGYAPGVMPQTLRVVGRAPLPAPRPFDAARFFSGADDGMRVVVRGTVQNVQSGDRVWLLRLNAAPGIFVVELPRRLLSDPAPLVDAEVSVTGVAMTRFNTRGEITLPRVCASQPGEWVIERPGLPAFDAPRVALSAIQPYRREPAGPHRVRVVGTVTLALPGRLLYLQDGDSAVRVQTHSRTAFQPGDRVEAAGFSDMSRYIGALVNAEVRKVGSAPVPPAVAITPEEIIGLNERALFRGLRAQPHDFDGHAVRFRAELLAVQRASDAPPAARRLVLRCGTTIVSADVQAGARAAVDDLRIGSVLEVTGIVQLEYTPVDAGSTRMSLIPTRLSLLLSGPTALVVVHAPSWWTPRRLLAAVAVVAAAFGGALLWIWQLRRQVRRKAEQLAREIGARRDAAVEFQATLRERNRLAANLHDTLLQTLGGIGFEIGACEAEAAHAAKPLPRLAVARRILDLAVSELRNSVWALRSLPLPQKDLAAALRAVAERESAGKPVRVTVQANGDFSGLPDFVAGNLVLVAQEALRNALRHARPQAVIVTLHAAPGRDALELVVRDDGVGFVPGTQAGPADGHFGLLGMRERVERLDGTLTFTSAPGRGTEVRVRVPVRHYDEAIA